MSTMAYSTHVWPADWSDLPLNPALPHVPNHYDPFGDSSVTNTSSDFAHAGNTPHYSSDYFQPTPQLTSNPATIPPPVTASQRGPQWYNTMLTLYTQKTAESAAKSEGISRPSKKNAQHTNNVHSNA